MESGHRRGQDVVGEVVAVGQGDRDCEGWRCGKRDAPLTDAVAMPFRAMR